MWIADNWQDYALLDTGDGMKLERWKDIVLLRPDPQAIWPFTQAVNKKNIHAVYKRSSSGGGTWEFLKKVPAQWNVRWQELTFTVRPMGFKHTGLFPEQAINWEWMCRLIRSANREINVLNLFGYTGGATVACASAGARVCHVDAAKNMVAIGKENLAASGLADAPVRWIVDDCLKFVEREIRRGNRYDGIILDPPSYGRSRRRALAPGGNAVSLFGKMRSCFIRAAVVYAAEQLYDGAAAAGAAQCAAKDRLQPLRWSCGRTGIRVKSRKGKYHSSLRRIGKMGRKRQCLKFYMRTTILS